MTTIPFDTYELIKELKQSGFNEEQAEGLSSALKKTHELQLEGLATKQDLDNGLNRLELKIESELKLIKWGLALVIAVTVLPVLKELFT
jgi:uncharacterized pyridoxal phosphate-containing UPF0001 family protein